MSTIKTPDTSHLTLKGMQNEHRITMNVEDAH